MRTARAVATRRVQPGAMPCEAVAMRRAGFGLLLALLGSAAAAVVGVVSLVVYLNPARNTPDVPPTARDASGWLDAPFPLEPFPAVDLDGRDVSPSSWNGRVVLLNAWATWCAPCRQEMPALQALQDTHPDRLLVIGLLQDDVTTDDFAREFMRSKGLRYPVLRSTFEIETRLPPVLLLPTTFFIDARGRLAATFIGPLDPVQLEAAVRRLLSLEP